jgi:hypothetical protein
VAACDTSGAGSAHKSGQYTTLASGNGNGNGNGSTA